MALGEGKAVVKKASLPHCQRIAAIPSQSAWESGCFELRAATRDTYRACCWDISIAIGNCFLIGGAADAALKVRVGYFKHPPCKPAAF